MSWTNVSENEDENYITVFSTVISIYPLNTMKNIFRLLSKTSCNTLQIISPVFLRRWLFVFFGHCIVCHSPISNTDFPLWYLQNIFTQYWPLAASSRLQHVFFLCTLHDFSTFTNSWPLSTSLWLNLWAFYFLPNTELF